MAGRPPERARCDRNRIGRARQCPSVAQGTRWHAASFAASRRDWRPGQGRQSSSLLARSVHWRGFSRIRRRSLSFFPPPPFFLRILGRRALREQRLPLRRIPLRKRRPPGAQRAVEFAGFAPQLQKIIGRPETRMLDELERTAAAIPRFPSYLRSCGSGSPVISFATGASHPLRDRALEWGIRLPPARAANAYTPHATKAPQIKNLARPVDPRARARRRCVTRAGSIPPLARFQAPHPAAAGRSGASLQRANAARLQRHGRTAAV